MSATTDLEHPLLLGAGCARYGATGFLAGLGEAAGIQAASAEQARALRQMRARMQSQGTADDQLEASPLSKPSAKM